jgi:hypothetical protein
VLLQITGAPAGAVVITRTDTNGTGLVRLRTGQLPIAGALTVTDYEPALLGGIRYDVVDAASVTTTASTALDGTAAPAPGAELRRNLATNPRAVTAAGFTTNDPAKWAIVNNVATPAAHPLGIATCARATVQAGGAGTTTLASLYDLDALGAGASRGIGVSVYSTVDAIATVYCTDSPGTTTKATVVPAGVWTYCTTLAASTGYGVLLLNRQAGNVAAGDLSYVTGANALTAAVPGTFFDGASPDTDAELYEWAGAVNASASIAYAAVPYAPVTAPQIVGVQEPQLRVEPEIVTGYDSEREAASQVLRPIGRPDPIILLAPTRTREGQLVIWCSDYAAALDVSSVLASARILMLRQPDHPGMDMYFLAQSIGTSTLQRTQAGWRWQTVCRYVEVRSPALPLLGAAGWLFDDVVATYPTVAAVRATYADYNDLLVGP